MSIQKKAAAIIGCLITLLVIALYIITQTREENPIYRIETTGRSRQTVDITSLSKLYNLFGTAEKPEPASKNLFNIVNDACPNIAQTLHKLSTTYMQQGHWDDAYKAYNLAANLKPSRSSTIFL